MPTNAGGFTTSLQGFDELVKALQRFPEAAAEVNASAAIQAALVVVNDAQRRVRVRTGTLKRSLHAESEEQTPMGASALVGTDVVYAKWVEARYPFLRPAVDENHAEIDKEFTDAFTELAYEELNSRGPRGGVRRR